MIFYVALYIAWVVLMIACARFFIYIARKGH